MHMTKHRIILTVTGSVAAFKAAALASRLVQDNYEIQVILTDGARHFLGEATFEGLTGRKVLTDMFEAGQAMKHIELVDWADLVLVYPCSANTLTRLRAGHADDLAGCLFLANNFRKPWWIAPAMNSNMFAHPAVADSLEVLSGWGCRILPTGEGRMACGDTGHGRLIEPEDVARLVMAEFR
jgi:phosphopantothenoylcysteine decarboxylase/phosphopantothenate--cysteine ligase